MATSRLNSETFRYNLMTSLSDRALLERALIAIEEVLARADGGLDAGHAASTAAQQALTICLSAAANLVDAGQTLLRSPEAESSDQLTEEWRTLISHVKTASRSAHQAALVLSAEKNLPSAQSGGVFIEPPRTCQAVH
jgi:hypothetical protein